MRLLLRAGVAAVALCWLLLESGGAAMPASWHPTTCVSSMPWEFKANNPDPTKDGPSHPGYSPGPILPHATGAGRVTVVLAQRQG